MAAGARWKVVGVLAVLGATGAGLIVATGAERRDSAWWALIGVKIGLLVAASVVFWFVSWRMWPRRVFARPDEVEGHQRAFLRVGWALLAIVGAASALGVAATYLPY